MTAQEITKDTKDKMEKALHHVADQLKTIRTSRASPALVDHIRVEYYGTLSPLSQIAQISIPEPRQIMIKPFDMAALKDIEKAIQKSDLGIQPQSDGKVLRVTMPPLSGDQRKKYATRVKELCEEARIAMRNMRRDQNKHADQMHKDSKLTEDENKKLHEDIQKLLKEYEERISTLQDKKTAEVMEV
ncbi:MAG: ribosome recycling factor [Planctomycetota bacterium]|nr:ribosome recycling factor [Planctomycetota bacterium]